MELMTVLLFVVCKITVSHASTIFVERNVSLIKAHSECIKQGGTLAYPNDIQTCGNISNSKIWLGVTTQIAKYGCYENTQPALIHDTPLKCYKFCNSTLFGLKDSRCSCIDKNTVIKIASISVCGTQIEGFPYLWLYNETEKLSNSTIVLNCMYVKCPDRNSLTTIGTDDLFYTENCTQQLDGFACLVRNSENNTSVKPSHVDYIGTTIIDQLQTNYMPIQHVSTNTLIPLPQTELQKKSNVPIQSSIGSLDMTVRTSIQSTLASSIFSSFDTSSSNSGYVSTDGQHKSAIKTSGFRNNSTSVSIHAQSKIGSSIMPTNFKSDLYSGHATSFKTNLVSDHASKYVGSISVITSTISSTTQMFQVQTTAYGVFVNDKNKVEQSETNNMHSTTTMNSNNSGSHQFSTGLIVGITVSILVVLVIGIFGICRLRQQSPFKEKAEDYTITNTKDPNYHDIDIGPKKDKTRIENDSTHPMLTTKGVDIQFLSTDNISNCRTNISNNAYAVVVKIPATTVTTKADKSQVKDENTLSSIHKNDCDILNKLRPVSGNESGNLYETSGEHLDDNDPTYNTTTHMHTRDRELESDYDHI